MVEPTELAYLAGFFDGEGCITVVRRERGKMTLAVRTSQVNPAPLYRFVKAFGGKVEPIKGSLQPGRRQAYQWGRYSQNASDVLEALLPYLQVKRAEAEMGIALHWNITQTDGRRHKGPLAEIDIQAREWIYDMLKYVKHVDYDLVGRVA